MDTEVDDTVNQGIGLHRESKKYSISLYWGVSGADGALVVGASKEGPCPCCSRQLNSIAFTFSVKSSPHIDLEANEVIQLQEFVSCECLQLLERNKLCLVPSLPHCSGEFGLYVQRGEHLY